MSKRMWPSHFIEKKARREKLVLLTAYDYLTAQILDEAHIDALLVGDSLANVFEGKSTTLGVTIDQIIYHTQAVARGAHRAMIIADMPFLSYHLSLEETKRNAGRCLQAGAHAVKLEIGPSDIATVKALVEMGIPVMGHLGFTPQSVNQLGGYKVQGKNEDSAQEILRLAQACQSAGCFSVVLEMVPAQLAKTVSELLTIPTIGIGAGHHCDGQILVTPDLLGMSDGPAKKFVKAYANLRSELLSAVQLYKNEVEMGQFPSEGHAF